MISDEHLNTQPLVILVMWRYGNGTEPGNQRNGTG